MLMIQQMQQQIAKQMVQSACEERMDRMMMMMGAFDCMSGHTGVGLPQAAVLLGHHEGGCDYEEWREFQEWRTSCKHTREGSLDG